MARIGSRNEARFRAERPRKIRKGQKKAIRKQNRQQERTGMKLNSLKKILYKVHDNKMSPDVAYNTIVNAILDKDYKKKRVGLMEFFLSLFNK